MSAILYKPIEGRGSTSMALDLVERLAALYGCAPEHLAQPLAEGEAAVPVPTREEEESWEDLTSLTNPLLFGPYRPPAVGIGDSLYCERHKMKMEIVRFRNAPIPWPEGKLRGSHTLIVTGDFLRALKQEAVVPLLMAWGTTRPFILDTHQKMGLVCPFADSTLIATLGQKLESLQRGKTPQEKEWIARRFWTRQIRMRRGTANCESQP